MVMAAAIGAGIGAAGGIAGSGLSAALSAKEAKRQRKWQEKMRSTAYQATMKDMELAGLNPILAYGKGPTSAGQGAVGRIPDMGNALGSGAEKGARVGLTMATTAKEAATARNLEYDAERKKVLSDAFKTRSGRAALIMNELGYVGGTAVNVEQNLPMIKDKIKSGMPFSPGRVPGPTKRRNTSPASKRKRDNLEQLPGNLWKLRPEWMK